MAVPKDTIWKIKPHTKAKHDILCRYLGAWFGILSPRNKKVIYIDGFAGPGKYVDGEDGSPIHALNIALKHSAKSLFKNIEFIFVEEDKLRLEHLEKEISQHSLPSNINVRTIENQFDDTLKNLLDDLENEGKSIAPTFAFIDPFGYKGTGYKVVQRLLANEKTEVLINFMIDAINARISHPNPIHREYIANLVGEDVYEQIQSSPNRVETLRMIYQDQLKKIARFVHYFAMHDDNNRLMYYLFFATNNRLGHIRMKEAFWNIDPTTGFQFSDSTDPNQQILFTLNPSINLTPILMKTFSGRTVDSEQVKLFVEDETAFLRKHMIQSLKTLEKHSDITPEEFKIDGKPRRKYTYPDGTVIRFIK